ncbi:hypothetical protein L0O88_05530 [Bacteroides nordii]|jgi:hypothetical protein|uniref:hypothetical protein n=1 Tax=Bacteroides nordii TaxID=291645 RepID=UPI001EE03D44|nr:hypothetical protein [Bacteroides nordii]MCG4768548.1 hypothetical protein [Bacteroides nordii]
MEESEKLFEFGCQIATNQILFRNWLHKLYELNNDLKNEYNSFYQSLYYINLSELLNPMYGIKYVNSIIEREYNENLSMYFKLKEHLDIISELLDEEERTWIDYKRDCSCHIYVDSYYRIKDNLEERTYRKQIPLCDILQKIEGFLLKHDCDDKKADIYIFNKLYPYISKMFQDIVGLKG